MPYSVIAEAVLAGNGSDATIYTVPAGGSALITNITAYNSSSGTVALSIIIKENNATNTRSNIVSNDAVPSLSTRYYGRNTTVAACPFTLKAGQMVLASASGTGDIVRISGLLLT